MGAARNRAGTRRAEKAGFSPFLYLHKRAVTGNMRCHCRVRGLEADEKLVYQIIEQSATQGIWIRDIRVQSNLQNPRLQKVLKALEGRQLIKTVKLHTHTSKKMYMLFNLSPSEELTGGAWYAPEAQACVFNQATAAP
jgi:predicted transcriptional regulator